MIKKSMKFKLFSIDLDGTILTKYLKRISRKDVKTLQEYMDKGGLPFFNTGRPLWSTLYYCNKINKAGANSIPFISAYNGAYIKDFNDGTVYEKTLSHEQTLELYNLAMKLNVKVWFYSKRYLAANAIEASSRRGALLVKLVKLANLVKIPNLENLEAYKFNFISFKKNKMKEIYSYLMKNGYSKDLTFSSTSRHLIEVTPKGIDKGYAIRLLSNKYNIVKNEIGSIGDSFNDVQGFKSSALAIAVKPRNKKVLRYAQAAIKTNYSPITKAFNKHVFNYEDINKKVKFIIVDLDGTLLHPVTKQWSVETQEALSKCIQHKIPVAIATGRGIYDTLNIIKSINLPHETNSYIIANNGATIFDVIKGTPVHSAPIDPKKATACFEYVKNLNTNVENGEVGLIMHQEKPELFFYNKEFWEKYNLNKTGKAHSYDPWILSKPIYINEYPKRKFPCYKIIVKFANNTKAKFYCNQLKKQFPDFNVAMTSSVNVEMNAKKVDKGFAVKTLAKQYNISTQEIMIFGDSHNDIPMLRLSKYSFAPSESDEEVKSAAKYTIDLNDGDFIAQGINKFLFYDLEAKDKNGK